MALRIVHTSDVHLDTAFKGHGLGIARARRKREAIRNTFKRIIDESLAWPADIVLIAGDLFEGERAVPDTIGFLKLQFQRLATAKIPVVIAPGNHDPYAADSHYAGGGWGENVHIFSTGGMEQFEFERLGVTVFGVAHTSTHMQKRLCDVVTARERGIDTAILLAHASDETSIPAEKAPGDVWLPFGREELCALGYDYAALGHYHGTGTIEGGGRTVAAYAGSPEGLTFSETGRRGYLRVTIDGGAVEIEKREVSEIDFVQAEISCEGMSTREDFFEAVRALAGDGAGTITRITATGRVAPGFDISGGLPDDMAGKFFHASVVDRTLSDYDWESIEAEASVRGETARRFAQLIENAGDDEREILVKGRLYAMDALDGRGIELPTEVLRVD